MDYFIIRPDKRLVNPPKLSLPVNEKSSKALDLNIYPKPILVSVKTTGHYEYPDYFETPLMMISEKLKRIISKYERTITFQTAVLMNREQSHQEVYYVMNVPELDIASAEYKRDRLSGKKPELILIEENIKNARIFKIKDAGNQLIIRLDVAESLLRRGASGIIFEKIKVDICEVKEDG